MGREAYLGAAKTVSSYVLATSIIGMSYLLAREASILSSPVFALAALIAVWGCIPITSALAGGRLDPLSPGVLVPFLYTVYALGPLNREADYPIEIWTRFFICELLGLLSLRAGLYLGTCSTHRSENAISKETCSPEDRRALIVGGCALLLLAVPAIASQISAFGGFGNLLRVGYGGERYVILGGALTLGAGFEWWLLGSVLLLFAGLRSGARTSLALGMLLYGVCAGVLLIIGSRNILAYTAIFAVALVHYGHRRLPPRVVIGGIAVGMFLSQFYSLGRFFLPSGLGTMLSETVASLWQDPLAFLPWTSNEFSLPHSSLLEILQRGPLDLKYGSSYLGALAAPIPVLSRLVDTVAFNPSLWRLQTFYPEVLAEGGGLGFSPVAEGYLNFGALGIVAHLLFYGFVIGRIYTRCVSSALLSSKLLYAGSLPIFALDGLRINVASSAYKWTRIYLMPFFALVVAVHLIRALQSMAESEERP